jgi:hypothetical protein
MGGCAAACPAVWTPVSSTDESKIVGCVALNWMSQPSYVCLDARQLLDAQLLRHVGDLFAHLRISKRCLRPCLLWKPEVFCYIPQLAGWSAR